jgi:hypothetical protein
VSPEITDSYELAVEYSSAAIDSQASAAASIGPEPGPAYMSPELTSGGNDTKSIAFQVYSNSVGCPAPPAHVRRSDGSVMENMGCPLDGRLCMGN